MEARKLYRSPDTPKSAGEIKTERFLKWHKAPQRINGICVICTFEVLDTRRHTNGNLYCITHWPW